MDEENSVQTVAGIDGQKVGANLLVEHKIISLTHRPSLPDARRRVDIDRVHGTQSAARDNLLRFEDRRLSPSLQPNDRLHPLLLRQGNKVARFARVAAQRPLNVRVLASVHGGLGKAVVRIHSRRHHDEIDVCVCRQLLRRRIRTCFGRQVVGFNCSLGGFKARVTEREDLVVGRSSQSGPFCQSSNPCRWTAELPLTWVNVLLWPTPLYSQTGQ
jgi:hypothetical protein